LDSSLWLVLAVSLGIGLVAGFFMHRSDFCLVRAFRDLFLFRSTAFFYPLMLLIVVSAGLFEAARLTGWLPYYPFPWFAAPTFTNLLGGFLFGVGMVLAGGCVVGVLYKLGGGSLLALYALFGLLAGSALYAELHPHWSRLASRLRLPTSAVTLPQLLDVEPTWAVLALVMLGGAWCWRGHRRGRWQQTHRAEGFIPRGQTALVLAVLGLVSTLVIGMPLGVTTAYAKLSASVESLLAPAHVAGLEFFASSPLRYRLPFGGQELSGGAGPGLDVVALIQYPLICGIIAGAMFSAARLGEFRLHWRIPSRQVVTVFCGGVIMALGSRMTPGCNVWHLLGGAPLLTITSLLFIVGLLPGTWIGSLLLKSLLLYPVRGKS